MRFEIDGKEFTEADLVNWKRNRIPKVLHNLHKSIKPSDDTEVFYNELSEIKQNMTYDEIVSNIKGKLLIGKIGICA